MVYSLIFDVFKSKKYIFDLELYRLSWSHNLGWTSALLCCCECR